MNMSLEEITEKIEARFRDIPEYKASPYKLELKTGSEDNPEYEYIANGTLLLDRVIEYDNGEESKKVLELTAVYGGKYAEQLKIPAEQLTPANFAAKLPVAFRPARKGRAVASIVDSIKAQALIVGEETVYSHTGWIELDGKPVFLHAGGAVGTTEQFKVELAERLSGYRFSDENHPDKWEVFKKLANLAPKRIMYPLIAFAALSPLNYFLSQEGIEPAFLMFLYGKTGIGKSTLTALLLSLFGRFGYRTMPNSFKDTANALEAKGQALADVLTVIDDYHPTASRNDEKEMSGMFQSLCRSYGDRTGRTRLDSDSTLRKSYIVKGNALITGEDMPDIGESGLARLFLIELEPNDIDINLVSEVQALADRLSECMRDFISWIADNSRSLSNELKKHFYEYRNQAATTGHRRTAEQIAHLMVSVKTGAAFLSTQGVVSKEEANKIISEAWNILIELGEEQTKSIKNNDPCVIFLTTLKSLLDRQIIVFSTNRDFTLSGRNIGYHLDGHYYVKFDPCYKAVNQELFQTDGGRLPVDKRTLKRRLLEAGYIVPYRPNEIDWIKSFANNKGRFTCFKESIFEELPAE